MTGEASYDLLKRTKVCFISSGIGIGKLILRYLVIYLLPPMTILFFISTVKDAFGTSLLLSPRLLKTADLYTAQNGLSAKRITL